MGDMMLAQLILFSFAFLGSVFMESLIKRFLAGEIVALSVIFLLGVVMVYKTGYKIRNGWNYGALAFSILLGNLVFLAVMTKAKGIFLLSSLFGIIGLIRAIAHISKAETGAGLHIKDPAIRRVKSVNSIRPEKVETIPLYTPVVANPKVAKTKEPKGEFVASAKGDRYHNKDCGYAKRIENRIFLRDRKDARRKGYTRCSCIK